MSVIFAKPEQRTTQTVVGTVKALGGQGAKVRWNKNSLTNKSADAPRLQVEIIKADGTSAKITLSAALSKDVRDKVIEHHQVYFYPIVEQTTLDGEIYYQINKPSEMLEDTLDKYDGEAKIASVAQLEDAAF